jgi:hypothetical protein
LRVRKKNGIVSAIDWRKESSKTVKLITWFREEKNIEGSGIGIINMQIKG